MKRWIVRTCFAILTTSVWFTQAQAQIAYTVHTIAVGESLSSLARAYHTSVGDIMRLNDMHADSKLQIGQQIKIPATSDPVQRVTATPKAEPAAPPAVATSKAAAAKEALTHTVQSGESLYRISKTYNISVEKLMALNNLTDGGQIKVGQVLVVSDGTPPAAPTKQRAENTPATTTPPPVNEVQQQPAAQAKQTPAATPPATNNAELTPPVQKQVSTPVATTQNNVASQAAQPTFASNIAAPKEGFFTAQFKQNVEGRSEQTKSGAAMTFKSASGWGDKKFYILMNDAPPGSIVKITNGKNAVYAKVLWSLGAQKENDGLDFRISTAAAAALNISDEKFDISVTYFE